MTFNSTVVVLWYITNYLFYCVFLFSELHRLIRAARHRRYLAMSRSTHANHLHHLTSYVRFCMFFQLPDFPANDDTLSLFAEFLLGCYQSPYSVLNALSSIKFFHLLKSFDVSGFGTFRFKLTRLAIPKSMKHVPQGACPLDKSTLKDICEVALAMGKQGLAFAALCMVAFFAMARLSSLVPMSRSSCDLDKILTLKDIEPSAKGYNVYIKWGKTQQNASAGISIPILRNEKDFSCCPVLILSKLILSLGNRSPRLTPLFAWNPNTATNSISYFTIPLARIWLNKILRFLKRDHLGITFHSLRRGSCQLAYKRGVQISDIKFMGNWKSDAISLYLPAEAARFRTAQSLSET